MLSTENMYLRQATKIKSLKRKIMPQKGMSEKQIIEELQAIKKLLILLLIKSGATSEEIGLALGVDSSVVRRMFPMKEIKKFKE